MKQIRLVVLGICTAICGCGEQIIDTHPDHLLNSFVCDLVSQFDENRLREFISDYETDVQTAIDYNTFEIVSAFARTQESARYEQILDTLCGDQSHIRISCIAASIYCYSKSGIVKYDDVMMEMSRIENDIGYTRIQKQDAIICGIGNVQDKLLFIGDTIEFEIRTDEIFGRRVVVYDRLTEVSEDMRDEYLEVQGIVGKKIYSSDGSSVYKNFRDIEYEISILRISRDDIWNGEDRIKAGDTLPLRLSSFGYPIRRIHN